MAQRPRKKRKRPRVLPPGVHFAVGLGLPGGHDAHTVELTALSTMGTIGRAPSCDVVVHDQQVSATHARLQITAKCPKPCLCDPGSANGTLLNGDQLRTGKLYMLESGDAITVGATTFTITIHDKSNSTSQTQLPKVSSPKAPAPSSFAATQPLVLPSPSRPSTSAAAPSKPRTKPSAAAAAASAASAAPKPRAKPSAARASAPKPHAETNLGDAGWGSNEDDDDDDFEPTGKKATKPVEPCIVCGKDLSSLDAQAKNHHVNTHFEGGEESADDAQAKPETFQCHVCQKDLTNYNTQRRQQHVNRCLDKLSGVGTALDDPVAVAKESKRRAQRAAAASSAAAAATATAAASDDGGDGRGLMVAGQDYKCRYCGRNLTHMKPAGRISHLKACAGKTPQQRAAALQRAQRQDERKRQQQQRRQQRRKASAANAKAASLLRATDSLQAPSQGAGNASAGLPPTSAAAAATSLDGEGTQYEANSVRAQQLQADIARLDAQIAALKESRASKYRELSQLRKKGFHGAVSEPKTMTREEALRKAFGGGGASQAVPDASPAATGIKLPRSSVTAASPMKLPRSSVTAASPMKLPHSGGSAASPAKAPQAVVDGTRSSQPQQGRARSGDNDPAASAGGSGGGMPPSALGQGGTQQRHSLWALSAGGAVKSSQVTASQLPPSWDTKAMFSQSAFQTDMLRQAVASPPTPAHVHAARRASHVPSPAQPLRRAAAASAAATSLATVSIAAASASKAAVSAPSLHASSEAVPRVVRALGRESAEEDEVDTQVDGEEDEADTQVDGEEDEVETEVDEDQDEEDTQVDEVDEDTQMGEVDDDTQMGEVVQARQLSGGKKDEPVAIERGTNMEDEEEVTKVEGEEQDTQPDSQATEVGDAVCSASVASVEGVAAEAPLSPTAGDSTLLPDERSPDDPAAVRNLMELAAALSQDSPQKTPRKEQATPSMQGQREWLVTPPKRGQGGSRAVAARSPRAAQRRSKRKRTASDSDGDPTQRRRQSVGGNDKLFVSDQDPRLLRCLTVRQCLQAVPPHVLEVCPAFHADMEVAARMSPDALQAMQDVLQTRLQALSTAAAQSDLAPDTAREQSALLYMQRTTHVLIRTQRRKAAEEARRKAQVAADIGLAPPSSSSSDEDMDGLKLVELPDVPLPMRQQHRRAKRRRTRSGSASSEQSQSPPSAPRGDGRPPAPVSHIELPSDVEILSDSPPGPTAADDSEGSSIDAVHSVGGDTDGAAAAAAVDPFPMDSDEDMGAIVTYRPSQDSATSTASGSRARRAAKYLRSPQPNGAPAVDVNAPLHRQLLQAIRADPTLHDRILCCEAVKLKTIVALAKRHGIKYTGRQIPAFLQAQGINFKW